MAIPSSANDLLVIFFPRMRPLREADLNPHTGKGPGQASTDLKMNIHYSSEVDRACFSDVEFANLGGG